MTEAYSTWEERWAEGALSSETRLSSLFFWSCVSFNLAFKEKVLQILCLDKLDDSALQVHLQMLCSAEITSEEGQVKQQMGSLQGSVCMPRLLVRSNASFQR